MVKHETEERIFILKNRRDLKLFKPHTRESKLIFRKFNFMAGLTNLFLAN